MTTATRAPEPDNKSQVEPHDRRLRAALAAVTVVAVVLGAVVLFDRGEQADAPGIPTAVDEALDGFVRAMEASDQAQLQAVVTPAFRRTFYQSDADGSPWRDVWRLERYAVWDNPNAGSVDWQIERGDRPIVQGSGPWYVSESQIWRNAAGGIQYEGLATFVVVETAGAVRIDDMYWAAQPSLLELEAIEPANTDATRADFLEWIVGRFVSAGLDPPDPAVVWLPPSLDCTRHGSHARPSDPGSGERHTVTLCFDDAGLLLGEDVDGRWSDAAARFGLHEFAHVWMYTHLDDGTREDFVERAELDVWRDDRAWHELGVEHAAETIAWGVAGSDAAQYVIDPQPPCEELAARFELLTGVPPFTSCATS